MTGYVTVVTVIIVLFVSQHPASKLPIIECMNVTKGKRGFDEVGESAYSIYPSP